MNKDYYEKASEIYKKRQREEESQQIKSIVKELEEIDDNTRRHNIQKKCPHKTIRRISHSRDVYCGDCGKDL